MKGLFLSQVSGTTGLILLEAKQLAWDASAARYIDLF